MASNWYYGKQGQQVGPVSSGQLRQLAQTGQLLPDDLVWKEGMAAWVAASSVPGLFPQIKQKTGVPMPQPEQTVPNVPAPSSSNLNLLVGLGGGAVALIMLCCCGGVFFSSQSQKAARKDLAEANRLWDEGDKAEAVAKYKSVVRDHLDVIANDQRSTVFQRIIETDVEAGDTSSAKVFIQKALDKNIALSLSNPLAKKVLADIQTELALAKQKAAQEKPTEKTSATRSQNTSDRASGKEEPRSPKRQAADLTHPFMPLKPGNVYLYTNSKNGDTRRRRCHIDGNTESLIESSWKPDGRYRVENGSVKYSVWAEPRSPEWQVEIPRVLNTSDTWDSVEMRNSVVENGSAIVSEIVVTRCCEAVSRWDAPPSPLQSYRGRKTIRIREKHTLVYYSPIMKRGKIAEYVKVYAEGVGLIKEEHYHPTYDGNTLTGQLLFSTFHLAEIRRDGEESK